MTGNDEQTQHVLDGGILPYLLNLMSHTRPGIVRVCHPCYTKHTHTHALPSLSSVTRVLYVHAGSSVDCIKYHSWKQESSAGILVKYVSLGS